MKRMDPGTGEVTTGGQEAVQLPIPTETQAEPPVADPVPDDSKE